MYCTAASPNPFVVPDNVVAFTPVTVNCTVAPDTGVPFKFLSVATSFCVAPNGSGPVIGELSVSVETGTVNVTVAVAFVTPSALLMAVTITASPGMICAGAVYNPLNPLAVIVPAVNRPGDGSGQRYSA